MNNALRLLMNTNTKNTKVSSSKRNITVSNSNTRFTINKRSFLNHIKKSPKENLKLFVVNILNKNYKKYMVEFTINGKRYAWYSDNILARVGRSLIYNINHVSKSDVFNKRDRYLISHLLARQFA